MARRDRWPSKWWFWGVPALAFLHALVVLVLYVLAHVLPESIDEVAAWPCYVLGYPIYLFGDALDPVLEILNPNDILVWDIAQTLLLWVLAGLPVGLVLYGAAAVVCAIVPVDEYEERGKTDGS